MTIAPWSGRQAQQLVQLTLATYGDVCHLCGLPGANSADHRIPRSKGIEAGGTNDITNLRPAHRRCNYRRGNRPLPTLPIIDGRNYL